ncbi:MAG TPA: cytochrome c oxidase subunit 3 [Kofleriaceae bacterium]|jgi:cytochrome c oxidase subunit 3|nr:cytochrome c oxidase subunit 3 [Kofleriaceae bacterium]
MTIEPVPIEAEVQFENLAKQAHAVRFGIWVFLASELLLFAGLFALYTAYRTEYLAGFVAGVQHAELGIGTINTSLLVVSSYTAAGSLRAIRRGARRATVAWLVVSLALGVVFLALKGLEYSRHAAEGALPGVYYAFHDLPGYGGQLFFTLYYFMTGLHVLHLAAAVLVLAWLVWRVARRRTTAAYHADLEAGVLYWHLVDCIWIVLYPLFYLLT